jgi:FkbM family methyltransferase
MIAFKNFTENNDGLEFTNLLNSKNIRLKTIDPYTGLISWHSDMLAEKDHSYFYAYPRATNHFGFEILDLETNDTLLKINIHNNGYNCIESIDVLGKLMDFKYSEKREDMWAAYPLYDIFISKCYEHPDCKVESGDVVFDIGANLGFFSYYSILRGAKSVHAFEPGESQFKAIEDNFGSIENLAIEKKAVTEKNGILKFAKHKTLSVMSGIFDEVDEENYNVVECKTINLMDYCIEKNISKINFLKIDCEGSEYRIFENFSDDFLRIIDKIIMEYHYNTDGRLLKLVEKLENNGFTVKVPDVNSEIGILVAYQKVKN